MFSSILPEHQGENACSTAAMNVPGKVMADTEHYAVRDVERSMRNEGWVEAVWLKCMIKSPHLSAIYTDCVAVVAPAGSHLKSALSSEMGQ